MKKCLIMTMIIGGSLLGSAYTAEAAYTPSGCSNKPLCREFGYTKQSRNECATSDYLPCPFGEGYYCKTKNNGTGCVFGSILYDDLKCYTSSNVPSGRVPIGVVFDEVNTLAAALDEKSLKWGWISVDISGIDSSSGDYGKGNTKKIIDAFIAAGKIDTDRDTTYAAGYCYNYTTPGVGRTNWFLPDDATMTKMMDSVSTLNGVLENIPSARISVVGVYRDEKTLEPISYFQKLASNINERMALVFVPMLATGGSMIATIDLLKQAGCQVIKILVLVAAPEGIKALEAAHPDVELYTASIDDHLDVHGYIVPGLGDAGDKIFGTK